MYRQGDVLIVSLRRIPSDQIQYPSIPKEAVFVPRPPEGYALAEGRATGHTHLVASGWVELYMLGDVRFLRVLETARIEHEEHSTIEIPPGEYRVTGHHEARPGDLPMTVED